MRSAGIHALAAFVLVLSAGSPDGSRAAQGRQKIDVSKLGPQVGQRVPDFNLRDQSGSMRNLQSIMGPRGAMLVFVRSADWCPFCRTQLVELQGRLEELRMSGIGVAGISYDSQDILADFTSRHGIGFPLLSDVGSATIKQYGILNTVVEEALGPNGADSAVRADLQKYATANEATERHRGIPFPGTFIVDRQGRVTARYFEDYYWERNTVSNVLLRLVARWLQSMPHRYRPTRSTSRRTRATRRWLWGRDSPLLSTSHRSAACTSMRRVRRTIG